MKNTLMKKIITTGLILAASLCQAAFANTVYFGPTLYLQDLTTNNSNDRALRPTMSIGYSGMIGFYYLAAEIFVNPTNITLSNSHDEGGDSTRISQDYGASFIPGILLGEGIVGYLRLGVVSSKFRAPSQTKTGGQAGIGLQTDLSTAWTLRGEYVYSAYSQGSNIGSPEVDSFGVGLIYKLDGLA